MGSNRDRQRDQDDARQSQQTDGSGQRTDDPGGQQAGGQPAGDRTTQGAGLVDWVTETFLRTAVAILGVLLLLFAVGQIAGFDTIGALADLLSNEVVQWMLVAVFALLLIIIASKNWNISTSG